MPDTFFWGLVVKNACLLLIVLVIVSSNSGLADKSEEERKAKQAELDAACEVARQEKLVLVRAQYVEECIEKKQRPDRESCERFYADYGESSANQVPLFYDLPKCVTAHEYRTSYRSSSN